MKLGNDNTIEDILNAIETDEPARDAILHAVNLHEALLKSVKELRLCLSNWMEIADEEDKRDYDEIAIKNADKIIALAEEK